MGRLRAAFKFQPGEGRAVALLVGMMAFTSAGGSIGGNGIEALFYARFGVQFLPYMYVALGGLTLVTSLGITGLLGRFPGSRLYVTLPLILAAVLGLARLIMLLDLPWFFAVLWLGMNVIGALQGLLTWGLAGAACDTRQAKRLFPLFGAGGIFGAIVGGFGTRTLVGLLHAENLLLLWAGSLLIAFWLGQALVSRQKIARMPRRGPPPSVFHDMQQGFHHVRRSPLLRWLSIGVVLFAMLLFSLAFPFSRAAVSQYPDADALAGFLGLFQGMSTGAAFIASLALANRLFARFGLVPIILTTQLIYLVGFGVLAIDATFAALVAFRFVQSFWQSGIAGTAYHAIYNVIPPDRRDQARAFVEGIPGQAGIVLAGVILVVGDQALAPRQLYLIGLATAVAATFVVWQAGRAYAGALLDALRAGQPQLFVDEVEPFGGFQRDAAVVTAAVAGAASPEYAVRLTSLEILGHLPVDGAKLALASAIRDPDPAIRLAGLRGLTRHGTAANDLAPLLQDADPDVRREAIDGLARSSLGGDDLVSDLRPLLGDADSGVRARAALALLKATGDERARGILLALANDPDGETRRRSLEALGEWGDPTAFASIEAGLADQEPLVRRTAATAAASFGPDRATPHLVRALADSDRSVRAAAAAGLGRLGQAALGPTIASLADPAKAAGALQALGYLPSEVARAAIRDYARGRMRHAVARDELWRAIGSEPGEERQALLAASVRADALANGLLALRAVALVTDRETATAALESLGSADSSQRANALETLEALGERELVVPLLRLWESADGALKRGTSWSATLFQDPDPWIRCCAAFAADLAEAPDIRDSLARLAADDPDPEVRDVATSALDRGATMQTISTLSLMERLLFLRKVPLFVDLTPSDLKQVAAIASERYFPDGDVVIRQGDPGDELYVIVSGELRLIATRADGRDEEIARRGAGDYVGEMALLARAPRVATLIAVGDVRALALGQKEFEGLLRERPETSLAVIRVLCARLAELQG